MLCNLGASVKLNMTLRDGTIISTLGYSLSKSLINVAYLIMDQGSLIIGKLLLVVDLKQDTYLSPPQNLSGTHYRMASFKWLNCY